MRKIVCDRCKKEIESEKESVMVGIYADDGKTMIKENYDLCKECAEWIQAQITGWEIITK